MIRYFPAFGLGLGGLIIWQIIVDYFDIPKYLFPSPVNVLNSFFAHGGDMLIHLGVTMEIAVSAFFIAVVVGVGIAFIMVQNEKLENAIFPYVIIIQVTPVVALAPLIVLLINDTFWALVLCAFLIAIFPVISNTILGLKSVPPELMILFKMYNAGKVQTFLRLRIMNALPYFFGSLKITSGLSIVGAVVGGFVAGSTGSNSGISYDILQDGYNLEVSRMFCSVFLLSIAGILFFSVTSYFNWLFLRKWHESLVRM